MSVENILIACYLGIAVPYLAMTMMVLQSYEVQQQDKRPVILVIALNWPFIKEIQTVFPQAARFGRLMWIAMAALIALYLLDLLIS